jgi:hypothetical protein
MSYGVNLSRDSGGNDRIQWWIDRKNLLEMTEFVRNGGEITEFVRTDHRS